MPVAGECFSQLHAAMFAFLPEYKCCQSNNPHFLCCVRLSLFFLLSSTDGEYLTSNSFSLFLSSSNRSCSHTTYKLRYYLTHPFRLRTAVSSS